MHIKLKCFHTVKETCIKNIKEIASRHLKRSLASIITNKMQVNTTISYHLTPVRMVSSIQQTKNVVDDMANGEVLYALGGDVNWICYQAKAAWSILKTY